MSTIILNGIVCDNTCFGYQEGDNAPDYLALFGPTFGQVSGPWQLSIGDGGYSLSINGHTLVFGYDDPNYSLTFDPPSFLGSIQFKAIGDNAYGLAAPEYEYLCPTPSVPEPATWMCLLIGFVALGVIARRKHAIHA